MGFMTEKNELNELKEQFLALDAENFKLNESLNSISLMLDNRGWTDMVQHGESGLNLDDLKRASSQLRELATGNPLMKRGYKLRSSYVWSRSFNLPKLTARVKNKTTSAVNERALFSPIAHEELELAAYTDGNVFVLGRKSDAQFMRVPMTEISGVMTDPDNNEVIWAVRRTWMRMFGTGAAETVTKWYYTDSYPEDIPKSAFISNNANTNETADLNYVMFHQPFNSHIGWTFGIPDALPAIAWSKLYREFLENGAIMTKAMAQFAYKISAKSRTGVTNAAAKVATSDTYGGRVGATAAMGSDMDLMPMPKAGSGYDFESGRSLASMVAASLEVSVVALLADPGQSGAYGTAQTLDTPTMKAMQARQNTWTLFYKRILRFMGATDVELTWPSIEVEPTHRMVQALAMAWESGALNIEEYRAAIIDILDISETAPTAPKGIMIPNNKDYSASLTNDANPDPSATTAIVPAQGVSGKVGGLTK